MKTKVRGSDRRQKYPTEVIEVRDKKSKTRGKIIVIKDKSQRPKKVDGVLIDVSVKGRTTIEFSNRKFIDPFFQVLKRSK